MRLLTLVPSTASTLLIIGCLAASPGPDESRLESCFDTGSGLKCIATPGELIMAPTDVNGDGIRELFTCGDGASDSDADDPGSDESDEEDGDLSDCDDEPADDEPMAATDDDDDSDSSSDGDGDSDGDTTDSDGDDDSDSDNDGCEPTDDGEGDEDGDGVLNSLDCDCV